MNMCDKVKCGNCKDYVYVDHKCYMLQKDIKPHSEKYVYFDFETKLDPQTLMVRKTYSIKSVNSVNGYLTNQDTKDTHFLHIMERGMTFSLLQNG